VKWHRRVAERKALKDAELRELDRIESEARAARLQERIEEARNYLRSGGVHTASTRRLPLSEEMLMTEVAQLIERLDQANVSDFLVKRAMEKFLDLVGGVQDERVRLNLRNIVVQSTIARSVISQRDRSEERQFIR
jgi:hypothetical protein